jgi:hypothetical protein
VKLHITAKTLVRELLPIDTQYALSALTCAVAVLRIKTLVLALEILPPFDIAVLESVPVGNASCEADGTPVT